MRSWGDHQKALHQTLFVSPRLTGGRGRGFRAREDNFLRAWETSLTMVLDLDFPR